jgi:hypothetical protein
MRRRTFQATIISAALLPTLALADGTAPRLREGEGLRAIDPRPFVLAENRAASARHEAALRALEGAFRRASPARILTDGNRRGRRQRFVLGVAPWRLHVAFAWNDGDELTREWYPQGLTGLRVGSKSAMLVSWYHKGAKGVRVSFADVTDVDRVRYRHALLVEPVTVNGRADVRAVPIHAGGIALSGRWLYVADTSRGFRVFDIERALEASTDRDDVIGVSGGKLHAFGYKYVIPQVAAHEVTSFSAPLRFSSVAIDRSTTPESLVTCEYNRGDILGRVFRWPIEAGGGVASRPTQAFHAAHSRMQGVASWRGQWFLACSSQNGPFGALYTTEPRRASEEHSWSTGAESLYLSTSGNLWSLSEHPGDRAVFCVKRSAVDLR